MRFAIKGNTYVARLSDPPTPQERLQLLAARLQRRPDRDHATQVPVHRGMGSMVQRFDATVGNNVHLLGVMTKHK